MLANRAPRYKGGERSLGMLADEKGPPLDAAGLRDYAILSNRWKSFFSFCFLRPLELLTPAELRLRFSLPWRLQLAPPNECDLGPTEGRIRYAWC